MIPEKYRILMNSEIDGAITPAERDELELYFVSHPEVRQYFEELKTSLEVLDELGGQEPPADLHGRIMRAVRKKKTADRVSWQEFIFGRLRMGYAVSAVVGVLAGFMLHALFPVDGMGRDLTALDLFRGTATTEMVSGWEDAGPVDLAEGGVEGSVHSYRLEDKMLVRLTLRASRDVRLGFTFEDQARLRGIHYSDNQGFTTASKPGAVEMNGSGFCQCEFLIDGVDLPGLEVVLDSGQVDGTAFRKKISWR